jgi:HEAT repeat protein
MSFFIDFLFILNVFISAQQLPEDKILSSDPGIRRQAILEMTSKRDPKYIDYIEKYIDDENKIVKLAAIEAAGIYRSTKTVDKIISILSKTTDNDIKNSCLIAISYMPNVEKRDIIKDIALKDKDDNIKSQAIRILANLNDYSIENDMLKVAEDKKQNPSLRTSAISYLSKIKSEKAKNIILKALKDENKQVRIEAIRSCGDMQIKESIETLRIISGENDSDIQLEASFSLAKLGDSFPLKYMYSYLDNNNPFYKNMALNIIGIIGDEESIKILDEKIKLEKDPNIKSFMEFTREIIKGKLKIKNQNKS